MTASVIIPTTGAPVLRTAVESVLSQSYDTTCYVVCDGEDHKGKVKTILDDYLGNKNLKFCYLPLNVGANGFYGHRIYAAFTHLVNSEYVLYLDQDNWFEKNHVESCIDTINNSKLDWCYSLRNIYDKESNFVCEDNCESLGQWLAWTNTNHVDTNSYCIKTKIAVQLASAWHGGWGQDRVFLHTINQYFNNYACTGKYTTNYRVDGGAGSVNKEFFIQGNDVMTKKYNGEFPWKNKKT